MIYILTPNGQTGGIELLFQLCDCLSSKGVDSSLLFFEEKSHFRDVSAYRKYNIKKTFLEDVGTNVEGTLIVPEALSRYIVLFPKMKKFLWWESVDNFYFRIPSLNDSLDLIGVRHTFKTYLYSFFSLLTKKRISLKKADKEAVIHLVQSEYAKLHLLSHGVEPNKIKFLSDYISDEYIKPSSQINIQGKKAIVVYNPKKGSFFTKKLIARNPDLIFVPIQGMSPEQIRLLLSEAMIYIDFGNHPGKDRLPREAASCWCCILTSKAGAAANDTDVPIPNQYKFEAKKSSLDAISFAIHQVLSSYSSIVHDFDEYRAEIALEKSEFYKQINDLFIHR